MEGIFAIIGFFGSVPVIMWIVLYFRSKAHARMSAVIEKMIDKGDAVTPETIRALGIQSSNPHRDLKAGMILVAIALALNVLGAIIPEEEALSIMMGLSAFPLFVGIALIAFWYFFGRKRFAG